MWKLATILDFSLRMIGFGAMATVSIYNIALMWNSDNVFKAEFIVLFGLLVALCFGGLIASVKEITKAIKEDEL